MWLDRIVNSQRLLIREYEHHLLTTCGLTAETAMLFAWHLSKFLTAKYGRRKPDLNALCPQDFIRYLTSLSPQWRPNSRRSAATALRNFLRWLQLNGLCSTCLVDSVPTVSAMRSSGLPTYISDAQLAALLSSFDRSRPAGLRGYAAALCMARLGLRVGEVAQITLDDINWRDGTLSVLKSKGRRERILPLPQDVGDAMVAYLCKGRPPTKERHLFISHRGSEGTALVKRTLRYEIREAFIRAGVTTPSKGTRILRHTAATQLIRSGATIKEIADLFGHSSIDTTCIDLPPCMDPVSKLGFDRSQLFEPPAIG